MSKRIDLSQDNINQIKKWIRSQIKVNTECLDEPSNNRYRFIDDKYGITVGYMEFNEEKNSYEPFKANPHFKEEYSKAQSGIKNNNNNSKYDLKRNTSSINISYNGLKELSDLGLIEEKASQVEDITKVNDAILIAWAGYVMDNITEEEKKTIENNRNVIYADLFAPVMVSYYDYLDAEETLNSTAEEAHTRFIKRIINFNEHLPNLNYPEYTFNRTVYHNAILVGKDQKVYQTSPDLTISNNTFKDKNGMEYDIYIPSSEVPNNNYSTQKLPIDTIVYNNKSYVNITHLNDFK